MSTIINRSPGCKSPQSKIEMNNGDDTFCDSELSAMSEEPTQNEEPWAIRFAEMLRIEVAQNLLSFKNVQDINVHMKAIGEKVKLQIGLEPNTDMWLMFDQFFDSVLF